MNSFCESIENIVGKMKKMLVTKRAENTVGKGEIAHDEQFLLFPQCFLKICTADMSKQRLVWERARVGKTWDHVIKHE